MKNKDQNIKNVGYDWTLPFNQVAAMNAGLLGKIKGDEILIFESFIKFGTWQGCEKIVRDNKIFYHYEWKKVVQRLPFLGLNSRSPIKKRFQNLVDIGLLIPHPNNETMCKSYYAFGALYDVYSNRAPSSTKDGTRPQPRTGRPQRRTGASSTKDGGVLNEGRYPSSDKDAMMYNNDNNNDNNNEREKRATKKEIFSHDVKKQIQDEKIFYDSPENRIAVWKFYQQYIQTESFNSHFEMSAEKYPNVEKVDLMKNWVMRADWDAVKNVKINLIGNWIRIAEANFQKTKKNGRNNKRLVSEQTAKNVFIKRTQRMQ